MMGNLYIIPTPIGNLSDITYRAIDTLKQVDLILCEDTRVTSKLLNHYEIKTKLKSYHKFNESTFCDEVIKILLSGEDVALVSDAGTPIISDPGSKLVVAATENNIKVTPLPGACAVTTAVSAFGVDFKDFLFIGFLPEKKMKRREILESLIGRTNLAVLYVGPHDLKKYLNEIKDIYPGIEVCMGRELTKIYEEIWKGTVEDLINKLEEVKGEIVLGINFASIDNSYVYDESEVLGEMNEKIQNGFSVKDASKELAEKYKTKSSEIYNLYVSNKA